MPALFLFDTLLGYIVSYTTKLVFLLVTNVIYFFGSPTKVYIIPSPKSFSFFFLFTAITDQKNAAARRVSLTIMHN